MQKQVHLSYVYSARDKKDLEKLKSTLSKHSNIFGKGETTSTKILNNYLQNGDKLLHQALKLSGKQFFVEKNESQKNIIDNYSIPKLITTKTQGVS
jgi:hypothetical protein